MKSVEASGKTRKEAIQKALQQLGAELHEAKVEILDEGSRGFLGLGARDAKVRVSLESDAPDARGHEAAALLEEVIRRMGIDAEVNSEYIDEGGMRLNIESPDSAILIGRRGKNLEAMQYLINRMVNTGEDPDKVERIVVDIEGYVDRRREGLEDIARRQAQRAKETGRRVRLKPMNPQERRVIHMTLQDDPDINTFSVGNAQVRSVVIEPKNAAPVEERPARAPRQEGRGGQRGGERRGERRGGGRGGESRGPRREGQPQGASRGSGARGDGPGSGGQTRERAGEGRRGGSRSRSRRPRHQGERAQGGLRREPADVNAPAGNGTEGGERGQRASEDS